LYDLDTISFVLGIFFLWGCFKLFEEYLWFRVLAATFGICLTLCLPIGSLFIAYISLFEEGILWLAIVQVLLGWTFGAITFWYSVGPYIKFMKETFKEENDNHHYINKSENIKNDNYHSIQNEKRLEAKKLSTALGLTPEEEIKFISNIKDFNGVKIAMANLKNGSGVVIVYNTQIKKWVKAKSIDSTDILNSPPWIEDEYKLSKKPIVMRDIEMEEKAEERMLDNLTKWSEEKNKKIE